MLFRSYLDTEIYLVSSLSQVVEKLEEQIAQTLVLANSPYTRFIET